MKQIAKDLLEYALTILLVPQLFVHLYYFRQAFLRGGGAGTLILTLLKCGLALSCIIGPALLLLTLLIRHINRERVRGWTTFLTCLFSGYAMIVAWNMIVYPNFSYGWALLPVFICSAVTALFMLGMENGAH